MWRRSFNQVIKHLEISDRDGVFYSAEALIEDDSVVVYSKRFRIL